METRLKERLTGAAILVALIVLVVPELFHGQRPDMAANTSSSSGEGPPVRSYTIDLSNGPARTAPLQSTDSAGETAPSAAPPNPNGNANPTPASSSASSPANTSSGSATPAPVTPTPKTRPPPPAPAPTATAASPTVAAPNHAAAKTASASSWSVQLGLFASRENAERLMHSAQSKGFPVSVSDADGKGLYHVVAAGLADRAAAQTLQGRLQSQGFPAALVAPQSGNLKSQR
jgi:DedD protein